MAIRIENRLGFNFGRPLGQNALYSLNDSRITDYDNCFIRYDKYDSRHPGSGTYASPKDITSDLWSIINAGKVNLISILNDSADYEVYYKFTLPSDIGCYHIEMDTDQQVTTFKYMLGVDEYLNFLGVYSVHGKPTNCDFLISNGMTWYPPGSTVTGSIYYWDAEDDYDNAIDHILLCGIPYFGKVV